MCRLPPEDRMTISTRVAVGVSFIFVFAVCGMPLRAQDSVRVERPSADLITREQIDGVKSASLYDVVEALHSNWLRERIPAPVNRSSTTKDTTGKAQYSADYDPSGRSMPGANGGIQVYIDGTRVGGLTELRNIRPADVYSIRRINGIDAQARFGIGHSAGVLYVVTVTFRGKAPD
jgi:hypothetical protein